MAETTWTLQNARLEDGVLLTDVVLEGGLIAAQGAGVAPRGTVWDLGGRVLLPGLVDAHVHLDKTLSTTRNRSGTLGEAIRVWGEVKRGLTKEDYLRRGERAVRMALAAGTTAMRTHVDVDGSGDLTALEALLELRERVRPVMDLELVALGNPGVSASEDAAMRAALALDPDVLVGGAPALAPDPVRTIEATFRLAEAFGRPIDLHVDETEDPEVLSLEAVAEKTLEHDMAGRVSAGHLCSLSFADDATAGRVMDKVAEAELNVVTLPSCNLVLQGRGRQPAPRGLTRVRELLARGVNVAAASDNVRDPFNPLGGYDPLGAANLTAHAAHLTGEGELKVCLEMVVSAPARMMGRVSGLEVGRSADLVVLDTCGVEDAVAHPPPRLATFKGGRRVFFAEVRHTWAEEAPWT